MTEIQQNISSYVSQVSRLYSGQQEIENEWLVGPIPTDDQAGKVGPFRIDFLVLEVLYFYRLEYLIFTWSGFESRDIYLNTVTKIFESVPKF